MGVTAAHDHHSRFILYRRTHTDVLNISSGTITIKLLLAEAQNAANNFVFLGRQGFYDNVIFHSAIEGFMIQSGDSTGTGSDGPGYTFANEPVQQAYSRGIVAMANAGPDTNGSQFLILHSDYLLPPNYTIFGQVVAGVETIALSPRLPHCLKARVPLPSTRLSSSRWKL